MFYRTRVVADQSFTLRIFDFFYSCDLDLDRMSFIYVLDPCSMDIPNVPITSYVKAFESYRLTDKTDK